MTIVELEQAAAEHGYALVSAEMHEDLTDAVLEAEALRCDLERLTAVLVEDAIAAGLGLR